MLLQQALTKVPTNVQHFADLGVYKHLKKKTHLTKDVLFPHLPAHVDGSDPRKVSTIVMKTIFTCGYIYMWHHMTEVLYICNLKPHIL